MKNLRLKATTLGQLLALACAASFSPSALSASVTISGAYYTFQPITIVDSNPTLPDPAALTSVPSSSFTYSGSAGGFKAKDNGGTLGAVTNSSGYFEAFCADLFQSWGYGTYTYNVASMSNPQLTSLNQLADYYDQVTNAVTSAAFQLATWEILFEDTTNPSFNLGLGDFTASNNLAAISQANTWLSTLGQAQDKYSIGYLTQGQKQDLIYVTPSPVPLPAAAWLFGSALLGFVSLSNRRKI